MQGDLSGARRAQSSPAVRRTLRHTAPSNITGSPPRWQGSNVQLQPSLLWLWCELLPSVPQHCNTSELWWHSSGVITLRPCPHPSVFKGISWQLTLRGAAPCSRGFCLLVISKQSCFFFHS